MEEFLAAFKALGVLVEWKFCQSMTKFSLAKCQLNVVVFIYFLLNESPGRLDSFLRIEFESVPLFDAIAADIDILKVLFLY